MTYKMLLVLFGLLTLGLVVFLGNSLFLARRRYIILFQVRKRSRKRSRSTQVPETPTVPKPSFFSWWLKERAVVPAAVCGVYLLAVIGVYLTLPLLQPGARTNRMTAGIQAQSQQQKDLWKSYVELSLAAEKSPQDAILCLELARAQRDLRLGSKALASYKKVLYLDPLSLDARYELGCLAVAGGDTTQAATQVTELAGRWPRRPESHLLQARIEARGGNLAAVLAQLRAALAVDPANRDVRKTLLEALLQQKLYAEAARLAEEGLKPSPRVVPLSRTVNGSLPAPASDGSSAGAATADFYLLLARSQTGLGEYAKADATLGLAAKADPSSPVPLIFLGDLRMKRGEYHAALVAYEDALKRDPENNLTMNNIASLSVEHGFDLERAANLAARMYAKYPRDPAVADTIGWVLFAQGKKDQALPLLQFAAAGAPGNPVHRYHYGAALLKLGQTAVGQKELAAALKISREFDGAEKARALLGAMLHS